MQWHNSLDISINPHMDVILQKGNVAKTLDRRPCGRDETRRGPLKASIQRLCHISHLSNITSICGYMDISHRESRV